MGAQRAQPVIAGLITGLIGFVSAFAVVLAGLRGVGATEAQAASGLLALSVAMGIVGAGLSSRHRIPIAVAWSTPGAALLASSGVPEGGWPAAVGAFVVCGALAALGAVMVIDGVSVAGPFAPQVDVTAPAFELSAIVGLSVPLFLVTMASQNVTGMAVLHSFGYRPELRPILLSTGVATSLIGPMGGHAINLAAITQALAAGPDAGPDTSRRWIAAATAGATTIVLGLGAGLATALAIAAPPGLIEAVAGLALIGALTAALGVALADTPEREAAVITLVIAASGVTIAGISAPFWGLVAGLVVRRLQLVRTGPDAGETAA